LNRAKQLTTTYPAQYWLLIGGMLISVAGGSMVWPFMTIYMRQQLDVPLTSITLLLTLNSAAGLASLSAVGPLIDRFGRKRAMVFGLVIGSAALLAMGHAGTLAAWAVLQAVRGATGPLFRVGPNTMVADLLEEQRRPAAYALLRTATNVGVAIGPSVGGFITSTSYTLAFYIAAGAGALVALIVLCFLAETAPQGGQERGQSREARGYGQLLRDRPFLAFCATYTVAGMAQTMMMVLMPVYAKENFGVPENRYGLIMATNATMVVLFQYAVTRITERYHDLPVLAVGSLFSAIGVGSVAWGWSFPTFLASMVVLTIGEMILVPTATALAANLSPPDMRGRYMSVFGLTWSIGYGIGPVIGGFLHDSLAPVAIWYGGLFMGLSAAIGFTLLSRRRLAGKADDHETTEARV
jgi:MFS family permease